MKLTFRGHAYQAPAPNQLGSTSTDQPKIKLIYRGHTYDYTPRPAIVSETIEPDKLVVTLIYRGNTYEYNLRSSRTYQKPRTISWRWQF